MFRHQGKRRTLSHNKKIASLLSFVAGIVNIAGFLSVQQLTTNVTGHFAFFVGDVFKLQFLESLVYFFYILSFFLGSFVSSLLVELMTRKNERLIFVTPIIIESLILFSIAFFWRTLIIDYSNLITFSLLFAMGLQNSLVTRISKAIVRTTHLTGLFTDLGIELSQLFFYKSKEQKNQLITTIRLRLRIILYFFIGGVVGGVFYTYIELYVLFIPAITLVIGLVYDDIKFKLMYWKHSIEKNK